MGKTTNPLLVALLLALAVLWAMDAAAYQRYNDGCHNCHGAFTDATSPQGNTFYGNKKNKHEMHRNRSQMGTECNLCHTSNDGKNPFLGFSDGESGVPGVGCVGCHGCEADMGGDTGGSANSFGRGAGLRQHHTNAGIAACTGCHSDADPANWTTSDEFLTDGVTPPDPRIPSYYGTAFTLTNNPYNDVATFQVGENWTFGDFLGLDNDGDLQYDTADTGGAFNAPPVAAHGGPYWGIVGTAVTFDASASTDSDGTVDLYNWDFEHPADTAVGTGVSPTYTYSSPATYDVELTVTDDGGATNTVYTTAIIVAASSAPPVYQFSGMIDQLGSAVMEAYCRGCHVSPIPRDRHHIHVGLALPDLSDPNSALITDDDVDGDNGRDPVYSCDNCHIGLPSLADCTICHNSGNVLPHHGTAEATSGDCSTSCHGAVVDDQSDGHYIPTYTPSLITPRRSNGQAGPPATGAGACDYCHDSGSSGPLTVDTSRNLHHGTGLDTGNCSWCHDTSGGPSGADTGGQIRDCENCHGPVSLHNIQVDSPNVANQGSTVVGGEDFGYGHVGRDAGPGDSDCWGCHGFYQGASAPYTSAIAPTVYASEPAVMTAGANATVVLTGSALTNTTEGVLYSSDVSLTASDGTSQILTPRANYEGMIEVTIPGSTAAGAYMLRAVKTDSAGELTASNPVSFIILRHVHITAAECPGTTATITGGGFSGYSEGLGTAVIGARRTGSRWVTEEATVVSWSDTTIEATFRARPNRVTVHSIFGSDTSTVIRKSTK